MHIHRRQFVIGPEKFIFNENWKTYKLNHSMWLSFCCDLQVTTAKDINGQDWYILGIAIETLQKKKFPHEEIRETNTDRVPDLYSSWVGRWVLVGNGKIHLDASGLLGCFYGKDSEEKVWASSSVSLLTQILFSERAPVVDSRELKYQMGISWYTPPRSHFEGISQLLPSQLLNLRSGDIEPRNLMPEIYLDRDYEEIFEQIKQILITTLQRLAKITPDLWLGLTAGYDSRSILALSHFAKIQLKPFTRVAARMSVADMILPPKLAKDCGYPHIFIRNSKLYPERNKLVKEHTAGQVSKGDAEPFVNGLRDTLRGISIGGHGFAIAKGFADLHTFPKVLPDPELGAIMIAKSFNEPKTSSATAGFKDWLNWVLEHPQENLDWRDRFYLEQRQAGWLSSKEQLYDLNDLSRFPILNSAYLYSLFLSMKKEIRFASTMQIDLIEKTAPQLNQYPFNPSHSYFHPLQVFKAKVSKKYLPKYLLRESRKILQKSFQ